MIRSVRRQLVKPAVFIVVDDGSTDGSLEYLQAQKDIILVHQPYPRREYGVHTARLFLKAVKIAERTVPDWNFLLKLDGDLALPKDYIKKLLVRMDANPNLGICSGIPLQKHKGVWQDFYHGRKPLLTFAWDSAKLFRRKAYRRMRRSYACYGWDTLRDLYVQYTGMRVRSYLDIRFYDFRPNIIERGLRRWVEIGFCRSRDGFGFRHQFISAFRRLKWKPYILGAFIFILAYSLHRLLVTPIFTPEFYRWCRHHNDLDLVRRLKYRRETRRFARFLVSRKHRK
jgi:glycosyltransferase involved in cell wall biosynthesis